MAPPLIIDSRNSDKECQKKVKKAPIPVQFNNEKLVDVVVSLESKVTDMHQNMNEWYFKMAEQQELMREQDDKIADNTKVLKEVLKVLQDIQLQIKKTSDNNTVDNKPKSNISKLTKIPFKLPTATVKLDDYSGQCVNILEDVSSDVHFTNKDKIKPPPVVGKKLTKRRTKNTAIVTDPCPSPARRNAMKTSSESPIACTDKSCRLCGAPAKFATRV